MKTCFKSIENFLMKVTWKGSVKHSSFSENVFTEENKFCNINEQMKHTC